MSLPYLGTEFNSFRRKISLFSKLIVTISAFKFSSISFFRPNIPDKANNVANTVDIIVTIKNIANAIAKYFIIFCMYLVLIYQIFFASLDANDSFFIFYYFLPYFST